MRQDAGHHPGGRFVRARTAPCRRGRACATRPAPAARRGSTCRSTESIAIPLGKLSPGAPPMTVIEFIRWSVSFATSNSRHGVCFDPVVVGDPVQHALQHGQGCFGAFEFVGRR